MKKSLRPIVVIFSILLILALSVISTGCFPLGGQPADTAEGAEAVEPTFLSQYGTWIWLVVLVVAFYFLLIRPQRNKSKKQQDLMTNLMRGDEIVTIGGFYGRIKDVSDDSMIITISSGVDVKIAKSAIARKVGPMGSEIK
jgi:preprotein translocase subunit YajC